MTAAEAIALLNASTTDLAALHAAWLEVATNTHPDCGGAAEVFHAARVHYEQLRADLEGREQECDACKGSGYDHQMNGWMRIRFVCEICGGSGVKET